VPGFEPGISAPQKPRDNQASLHPEYPSVIVGSLGTSGAKERGMVDFKKLSDRAKDLVEKRGGTGSLKEDAGELKEIATGKGSLSDKAKAAAAALKDPGAKGADDREPAPAPAEPADEGGVADERAERKERRAERRKDRAERRHGGQDPA
jgi:hypothetical protein